MQISYRDLREHTIIMLEGDLDYTGIRELKSAILKVAHEKSKNIILDFRYVSFIDSSGMGMLVSVNKELIGITGKIGLIHVSDDILNLLKMATVDKIVKLYNDEDDID